MLTVVSGKRAKSLASILFLVMLLSATTALAATKFIEADEGGAIRIARGAWLLIPPGSLEEDTLVSANRRQTKNRIYFDFEPGGTPFAQDKPAQLWISWRYIRKLDDLILYEEDGSEIMPHFSGGWMKYELNHFSLYYFRRR